MRDRFLNTFFVFGFSILNCGPLFAQLIDLDRENPYKKVFVATDNFGPSYLDILEETYPKAQPDSLQFEMLNDLAYYWHTRNLVTALDFTKEGLQLASKAKDTLWEGRFQITEGSILLRMEKLDSAEIVLNAAKTKVRKSDLAFLNTQLGYVFERRGQLDRAADYAVASLNLGVSLNDKKAIALAYSDLSNLFWKQSKFDTGLEYGLKSLRLFEERNLNDLDYDFTLYVVGNNYLALKEYEKARTYYEHAITIGERYGFYNNLSDVYISLVDLYAYLNQFDKAERAGKNALKYAHFLENNFMVMRSWLSIGKLQNLQGKYISAIESLNKCIEVATSDFGDEYYLSQAYETLGKAYAGNHNYKEAYQAFAEYDILKNRIFTAEADQRISLLKTEFDVMTKEGTIQLQETEIKKQRSRQTMVIIISGLLLLLLFLSYKAIQNNVKKNKLLQQQNREKEFLLKEIHHRVKNNLEIVSSLLALQSAEINDPKIVETMQESQNRVHSMSMIHQNLYQGKSLSSIEMKGYFENLANYVLDAFGVENQVKVLFEMDRLELDVDTAIPIGLIVNELLTNSLKHAFPKKEKGTIRIGLKRKGPQLYMKVADNGVGNTSFDKIQGSGFGTRLIQLLTQQLDGKINITIDKGTLVSFEFQYIKAA
ncbi:tetratricopeptide repeat-containing sensor histidine kinase [Ulvibacterium marinum]|uniref:tetratricopeptide repeat-containing sensor histidine kinase n=1 Tax=Ulvibacterium marinum TaxID=2419782 RepID=UPI002493F10F|nr:histidine kinase dimerization/phosphoacceptor domain -containing protein [Ulvibacterium marinum]